MIFLLTTSHCTQYAQSIQYYVNRRLGFRWTGLTYALTTLRCTDRIFIENKIFIIFYAYSDYTSWLVLYLCVRVKISIVILCYWRLFIMTSVIEYLIWSKVLRMVSFNLQGNFFDFQWKRYGIICRISVPFGLQSTIVI